MRARGGLAVVALGLTVLLASCWGGDDPAGSTADGSATDALSATPAAAERAPALPAAEAPAVAVGSPGSPPCSGHGAPCAPRDLGAFDLFGAIPPFTPTPGVAFSSPEAPSVEEVLEQGLRLAGSSPVHLAFRGTATASSVRCEWRGVARTAAQREATIRSWLGLDEALPLPGPADIAQ